MGQSMYVLLFESYTTHKSLQPFSLTCPLYYFAATHQKGFIIYLGSSHLSYFLTLRIYDVIWPLLNENLIWSYRRKVAIFLASFAFLFIMVYYYYRHFIHCDQFGKLVTLGEFSFTLIRLDSNWILRATIREIGRMLLASLAKSI